jgi:CheY-like chemotaxis protein
MAHILVIDDERSIRNTLKEILEYEKFTVDLAEHGAEGLEKYKRGSMILSSAISRCLRWTDSRCWKRYSRRKEMPR